ncbi:unnamed protein product [Urochloa humidicola]
MAAPPGPFETTESTCAPKTARSRHVFRITGYSLLKGLGYGNFIRSATFAVGGQDWCVRFYPDGDAPDVTADWISVYIERLSKGTQVRALFGLRLTKREKNLSRPKYFTPKICIFNHTRAASGYKRFIKRSELEASRFLLNDRLLVVCDIVVILGTPVSQSEPVCEIQVPPSDLLNNLGELLESEEGADVTFEVEGHLSRQVCPCLISFLWMESACSHSHLDEAVEAAPLPLSSKLYRHEPYGHQSRQEEH